MDYIRMYVFNGNIIANSKKHGNEKIKFWQKKQAKHCGTALFVVKCCEISQKRAGFLCMLQKKEEKLVQNHE